MQKQQESWLDALHEYGFINTADIVFHPELRQYCEQNTCGEYNRTWACPKGVGSVAECRGRCLQYDTMLLFTALYPWSRWDDTEGLKALTAGFKQVARMLAARIGGAVGSHLVLATGGCDVCSVCAYPDAPCRFPDKRISSMSGYGMLITDLADLAGVSYDNGKDTLTLFGAILYNKR